MKPASLNLKPKGKDIYPLASRKAIRAYASAIQFDNPERAQELRSWADREMPKQEMPKFSTDGSRLRLFKLG